MKIAILTSGILPVPAVQGGAVENLADIYLEYNDIHKEHDITVYSVKDPKTAQSKALRSNVNHYKFVSISTLWDKIKKRVVKYTHKDLYYDYTIEYFLCEAMKDIVKEDYDVILMENRPGYALRLQGKTKARLVYHIHNDILNSEVSKSREICAAAHKIITVSDYIKGRVETTDTVRGKTVTVNNGIDLGLFTPKGRDVKAVRKGLGLADDDFVLLFSGRITKEKGIMELIEALAMLEKYDKVKLLVIGSSFFGANTTEDDFYKALREAAEKVSGRVIFTGFQPYTAIPGFLAASDAAVIPSVWNDPFPTTVLEAQAMGLPIITTKRGGIPEEVSADNAMLIDTGDGFSQRLAAAIEKLYTDSALRLSMAKASAERASIFTKEKYAERILKEITQ